MIHIYKENAGTVEMTMGDLELFQLTKIRVDNQCMMCRKTIKKQNYCLGKGNVKYCLDCADKVIDNACSSMNEYVKTFKKLKSILNSNKTEYARHNLANSL